MPILTFKKTFFYPLIWSLEINIPRDCLFYHKSGFSILLHDFFSNNESKFNKDQHSSSHHPEHTQKESLSFDWSNTGWDLKKGLETHQRESCSRPMGIKCSLIIDDEAGAKLLLVQVFCGQGVVCWCSEYLKGEWHVFQAASSKSWHCRRPLPHGLHSSEKKGLRSTFCLGKTLQNLPYL